MKMDEINQEIDRKIADRTLWQSNRSMLINGLEKIPADKSSDQNSQGFSIDLNLKQQHSFLRNIDHLDLDCSREIDINNIEEINEMVKKEQLAARNA